MDCSRPTVFPVLKTLEENPGAPIVRDRESGGYRYDRTDGRYDLPGLWFCAGELQALVIIQRFPNELGGGLLEEHFALLARRIDELTSKKQLNLSEVGTRIRMPALAARATEAGRAAIARAGEEAGQILCSSRDSGKRRLIGGLRSGPCVLWLRSSPCGASVASIMTRLRERHGASGRTARVAGILSEVLCELRSRSAEAFTKPTLRATGRKIRVASRATLLVGHSGGDVWHGARRFALTPPQMAIMQRVVSHEGISLKELSQAVGLAHSTVSSIIDRLVSKGMLERRADLTDGPELSQGPLERALARASRAEQVRIGEALRRLRELLDETGMELGSEASQ